MTRPRVTLTTYQSNLVMDTPLSFPSMHFVNRFAKCHWSRRGNECSEASFDDVVCYWHLQLLVSDWIRQNGLSFKHHSQRQIFTHERARNFPGKWLGAEEDTEIIRLCKNVALNFYSYLQHTLMLHPIWVSWICVADGKSWIFLNETPF